MKKRQIKINYIKGNSEREIALDDNFMFRLYEVWKGTTIKTGDKLDSIIKYYLPQKSDKAFDKLTEGITYNNVKYIPLMTSPSMMKKETQGYKCEYLFIKEDEKEFVELLRRTLSLNKINKLYNADKVCINKDIIARVSLALSGSYKIDYNPNIVILPSDTYKHTAKYVSINKGKLTEPSEVEKEFEFADGCGFMSPKMSEIIQKQMQVDYSVDFAGIRMYNGLATKGLVIKADWNKYFNKYYQYKEGIFEKREDGFYTKDYFGNMVNISKADLILNTNMCKFAKLWKDEEFTDINERINEELNKEELNKYKDVLGCLYVTKINKSELKEYTQISYQVLNNLALLLKELEQIQSDSEEYIKKVASMDARFIKLFMGDIAREEELELSASTKIHKLLQVSDQFLKTDMARRVVANLVFSKSHELVCEPYVKGNYKMASIDPICYLNWIMSRDIESSRELKEGGFFVPREKGQRVLTRNPLAVFSEIHRIDLTTTNKLEEYFGNLTNELIFFNQADNTFFISSGEDTDGDMNGVWENDLLYNAVIEPKDGVHFNNTVDGDTIEVKYSLNKEYESVLLASGNLIGKISNATTSISNYSQELGYIFKDKVYRYSELKEYWINLEKNSELKVKLVKTQQTLANLESDHEEMKYEDEAEHLQWIKDIQLKLKNIRVEINTKFTGELNERVENGKIVDVLSLDDEKIREIIINQFYETREIGYEALMWSQVAIDAPKTLSIPSKEQMVNLNKWMKMKKPRFMYFSKFTENEDNVEVSWEDTKWSRSALNISAHRINHDIIKPIKKAKEQYGKNQNETSVYKLLKDIAITEVSSNVNVIEDLLVIKENYNTSIDKLKLLKNKDKEAHKIAEKQRDYDMLLEFRGLREIYSDEILAYALLETKSSVEFIIKFAWDIIESAIAAKERKVTIFKETENGEVDWLFKKYTEVATTLKEGKLQDDYIKQLEKHCNTTSFNVAGLTGLEYLIENDTELLVRNEKEGKYENLVIYLDNKRVGFIYKNSLKAELTDGQIIKAKRYEMKKNFMELTVVA